MRAYECDEWQKSAQFDNLMNYIHHGEDGYNCQQLPLCDIAGSYVGQPHRAVIAELSDIGFSNVELVRKTDRTAFKKAEEGQVVEFAINGLTKCGFADWYAPDAYSKMQDGAVDPKGPETGTEHVVRGGQFSDDAADLRSAARGQTEHDAWLKTDPQDPKSIWWYSDIRSVGFRVVCEPPEGTVR